MHQLLDADPGPVPNHRRSQFVEVILLLAVCGWCFFVGLGRSDFVKTEGLRAIVAAEMLERPGLTMPTVHHAPYLKKPPLYAWTTTCLARALGRFDEEVARWPSAVCATALMLLLYGAGERWIGRGAGWAAVGLGLLNATVLDYGGRAELDMGFTFFATLANLLAWPALNRRGARAAGWWLAVYAAATLAAFWKGPHVLIFLWSMLLAWGATRRQWRWLLNPGQVVGLVGCLGLLIWWVRALATFAPEGAVAHTAVRELVSRLVPLSVNTWLSILWFVPVFAVITLPASLFVIAGMRRGVTGVEDGAEDGNGRWAFLRRWGRYLSADPFAAFLLCWLVPNLVFDTIAPAKAPRYALAHFAPVFLLAAWVLWRVGRDRALPAGVAKVELAWRGIYGVIGGVGVLASGAAVAAWLRPEWLERWLHSAAGGAWLVLGLGCCGVAGLEFFRRGGSPSLWRRLLGLLVVVVALKPLLLTTVWPLRAEADSMRAPAARIDAVVPEGAEVFVLGTHELPDVAFYSRSPFRFLHRAQGAADIRRHGGRYCLLRASELGDFDLSPDDGEELLRFRRAGRMILLIDLGTKPHDAAPATRAGTAPDRPG